MLPIHPEVNTEYRGRFDFGLNFCQQNGKSVVLDLADFISSQVRAIPKSLELT